MRRVKYVFLRFRYIIRLSDYINIIKTTFSFDFNLYQVFKEHGYTKTWKQREAVN